LPSRKKTTFEWWKDRIDTLTGYKDEASKLYQKVGKAYTAGYWTLLKLSILAYYIDIYTIVVKNNFSRMVYVDLFAGCGVNKVKIKDTEEIVMGSALLSKKIPRRGKEFSRIVLVEKDRHNAEILRNMIPEAYVIPGDCNSVKVIQEIKDIIHEAPNTHFLVVADPEGLELKWNTVENFLEMSGDIIVNYMCGGVGRIWGNIYSSLTNESVKYSLSKTMNDFFGTKNWKNCPPPPIGTAECLFDVYFNRIKNFREESIPIKVRGTGGFHYHMILGLKKTKGTQKWIKAVERIKNKVENIEEAEINRLIDIYRGRQRQLL
jgi:three-Cys-motif partner protein